MYFLEVVSADVFQLLSKAYSVHHGTPPATVSLNPEAYCRVLVPFLGWGLYRAASCCNHSCWPNAETEFPDFSPRLQVRIPINSELRQLTALCFLPYVPTPSDVSDSVLEGARAA